MFCEHRESKFIFFFAHTVVSSNPADGEVYSIQLYAIKFVSDFRQVGGFLRVSSTNKTDRHDITEILLKVALSTTTLTPNPFFDRCRCC